SFICRISSHSYLFFFNDPSTSTIYTLSLHDALPISSSRRVTANDRGSLAQLEDMNMKTRKDRRQTAKVSHSRWLAYATASAATALAGSHSLEAAIHYSGLVDEKF